MMRSFESTPTAPSTQHAHLVVQVVQQADDEQVHVEVRVRIPERIHRGAQAGALQQRMRRSAEQRFQEAGAWAAAALVGRVCVLARRCKSAWH